MINENANIKKNKFLKKGFFSIKWNLNIINIKITPGKTAYLPPTNPGFTVPSKIKNVIKIKETINIYDSLSFFFYDIT